jgi:hypothetical protein
MTLPASGAISLGQIAAEFGLASSSAFPSAFYGKGGAPGSGALSFSDFYGRSGASPISASPTTDISLNGFSQSGSTTITCTGGKAIASIVLIAGSSSGRIALGSTGGASTVAGCNTAPSGNGAYGATYRYTTNTGEFLDVSFSGTWGTL